MTPEGRRACEAEAADARLLDEGYAGEAMPPAVAEAFEHCMARIESLRLRARRRAIVAAMLAEPRR